MGYFEKSIEADASHLMNLFGKEDEHIRKIEDDLAVTIVNRGDEIKISGEEFEQVTRAFKIIEELLAYSRRGNIIASQNFNYSI